MGTRLGRPRACAHAAHVDADYHHGRSDQRDVRTRLLSSDQSALLCAHSLLSASLVPFVCAGADVIDVAVVADGVAVLVIRRLLSGASRLAPPS